MTFYSRCNCVAGENICNCSIKPRFAIRYNCKGQTENHYIYCCKDHINDYDMGEHMEFGVKTTNYLLYEGNNEEDINRMIASHKQIRWENFVGEKRKNNKYLKQRYPKN